MSLAPAALMEEMPEAQVTVVEETMPTVDGEDQAEPAEEDSEIVAAPVSEYVEEEEMSLDDSAQEPSDSVIQDGSSAEPADAVQAVPFDQSVTIDDVVIRLFGEAGAFPEGTILRAEKITDEALIQDIQTALAIEGEYIHNLYQ